MNQIPPSVESGLRVLSVNRSAAEVWRKEPEDIIGRSIFELFPEETANQYSNGLKKVFETGKPAHSETKMVAEGRETWISAGLSPVKDDKNEVVAVMGVSRDLTERKQVEEELRKHREHLEELVEERTEELFLKNVVFEASIAANGIADNEGVVLHVNPSLLRMWGFEKREEAIGRSLVDFFQNVEDATLVLEALNRTGEWEGEFLARRKDGSTFVSRCFATAVRTENGEQVGYQATNIDVTAQRMAEEQLKQTVTGLERANTELGRFNRLAVGRELRMVELKGRINELSEELGREPPYDLSLLE